MQAFVHTLKRESLPTKAWQDGDQLDQDDEDALSHPFNTMFSYEPPCSSECNFI